MLNAQTRVYLAVAYACGAGALLFHLAKTGAVSWPGLLLFGGLAFLSESLTVDMPGAAIASVSLSIYVSALVLFGPATAMLVVLVGAVSWRDLVEGLPLYKLAFNAAQEVLAVAAAALAYQVLGGQHGAAWMLPGALLPTIAAAVAFFATNMLLVAGVIAVSQRIGLGELLRKTFMPYATNYVAQVVLVVLVVQTYLAIGPAGIVLLIGPLLVARQTLQVYTDLKAAYEGTVRSLVAAIEAKDAYTRGHSERVAGYAEMIARELRMSDEQIDKLRIAALLHDLGKLGIQRRILSKTGRLTEDEFSLMQEHPELATAILRDVTFLEDIIPAIYHHHEHYDGSGYARNLKGEQIPLTARILAVADAYDAMISARPYRDALTPEMAATELVSCSGSQFDRKAVDALLSATGVEPQLTEEIGIAKGQLRFVDETT